MSFLKNLFRPSMKKLLDNNADYNHKDIWAIFDNKYLKKVKRALRLKPQPADVKFPLVASFEGVSGETAFKKRYTAKNLPATFYHSHEKDMPVLLQHGRDKFLILAPAMWED